MNEKGVFTWKVTFITSNYGTLRYGAEATTKIDAIGKAWAKLLLDHAEAVFLSADAKKVGVKK